MPRMHAGFTVKWISYREDVVPGGEDEGTYLLLQHMREERCYSTVTLFARLRG